MQGVLWHWASTNTACGCTLVWWVILCAHACLCGKDTSPHTPHSNGSVIPWEVVEKHIRATHPYEVFMLRAMLAVPYFEKVCVCINVGIKYTLSSTAHPHTTLTTHSPHPQHTH